MNTEPTPGHPVADLLAVVGDPVLRDALTEGMTHAYRLGVASARAFPAVTILPFICPACTGTGTGDALGMCGPCGGHGLVAGVDGTAPADLTPAPRPPAVMARPCADCAYRPGSPETDSPAMKLPGAEEPFFCHHGLHRIGDHYVSPAMMGECPLGAMVCAGWWNTVTGGARPEQPFRDPGGADRRGDAPKAADR